MSNHPTIAALRAALESERDELSKRYHTRWICGDIPSFKDGHEAATERLMTILEKAVEMADFIDSFPSMYGMGPEDAQSVTKKAREFLTTLADVVVIKKDLK